MKSSHLRNWKAAAAASLAAAAGVLVTCNVMADLWRLPRVGDLRRQTAGLLAANAPAKLRQILTTTKDAQPRTEPTQEDRAAGEGVEAQVVRTVSHADVKSFDKTVLKSNVPVLVDFYADWCGPCKMLAPVLDELARETTTAKFVKVNIDRSPELAGSFGVNSIPTLLVFKEGKVVAQHVGLASKDSLKRLLTREEAVD